jgi:hypothetical protein
MIDTKKVPMVLDDYQDIKYNVISVWEDKAGDAWGSCRTSRKLMAVSLRPSHYDDRHFKYRHFRGTFDCASVSLLLLLLGHTQLW